MSRVVALGEGHRVRGFALGGASAAAADDAAEVAAVWEALGPDVGLVLLTPAAARIVMPRLGERPELLTVVMP